MLNGKDIVLRCARLLNLKEICENEDYYKLGYVEDGVIFTDSEMLRTIPVIRNMLECLNLVVAELATDYIRIEREREIKSVYKKIPKSQLHQLVKVLEVKCGHGNAKFKFLEGIINLDHDDTYTVRFLYAPQYGSLLENVDEVTFLAGVDTVVYGVCAYYCLSNAIFDEYQLYYEKYSDKLKKLQKERLIKMPMRKWQ